VYFGHPSRQFCSEFPTAQVDVEQGRLNSSMASEYRYLMNVPIRSSKIGKAEVARRVSGELLHT
jgi:hypothetical protein